VQPAPARRSWKPDVTDIIKLLLSFGAEPNQRGVNDYTSLHMAVSERNLPAVETYSRRVRTRDSEHESTTAKRLARWPSR